MSKIPVMIGGGGEKQTLRMVAQYADESNIICGDAQIDRGLELRDESDDEQAPFFANFACGDPDTVGEHFAALLPPDLDGFTVNSPANGHIEGRVQLLGEALAPLIAD